MFERALDMTLERIKSIALDQKADESLKNTMKKHLMGVFLSAALYSPDATLRYLEQKQILE